MRAIIVDDEILMIRKFKRYSEHIDDLELIGEFDNGEQAIEFVKNNPVEVAFLDVEMPVMNGIELARELKKLRKDIIIVFVTAFDEYIAESNKIGGDYYLIKPYSEVILEIMMDKIRILCRRQNKTVFIQTFGRFTVKKDDIPIRLTGKAKEILALIVTKKGKEISNEEIYSTIWENRPYSNSNMVVYFNALRRLKERLKEAGIEDLLISTARGQMVNIEVFDCDYYAWKEKSIEKENQFEGEFLPEYSWGEGILANIMLENYNME